MAGLPGRITDDERARRLFEIERLLQEEMTPSQISDELGLSLPVIQRSIKYLEQLKKADITPEVLAEKRSELYLEYVELADEAKKQFELYKHPIQCRKCEGNGKTIVTTKKKEKEVICPDCKGLGYIHYPKDANRFLVTWSEIVEKKAKLYGLDTIKSENILQFNQFNSNQYIPDIKISGSTRNLADRLVSKLKNDHEERVRKDSED